MAFVQAINGNDGTGTAVTSVSTSAGSGFTSGNYIVGYVELGSTAESNVSSVTDGTNTYPIIDWISGTSSSGGPFGVGVFFGPAAAGKTTITANFVSGVSFPLICAQEISGVDGVLDGHAQSYTANISSTTQSTPSITTTGNGDYAYAFFVDVDLGSGPTSVSSPFTIKNNVSGWCYLDCYNIQSTSGSISATFTVTTTGANHDVVTGIVALSAVQKVVALDSTATSPWTLPADWPGTADAVYVIGAGGNGSGRVSSTRGGSGGGGGACVFATNYAMSSAPTFSIGAVGSAANTTFDSSAFVAAHGTTGTTTTAGAGGTTTASTVPTGGTKFAGGSGKLPAVSTAYGGGGGGAAGPNGAGSSATTDVGGAGDNGQTAAPAVGNNGAAGTEWIATAGGTYGAGSGASGFASGSHNGTTGGQYGGGGSGASDGATASTGGQGGGGLVVIVYTPVVVATYFPFSRHGAIQLTRWMSV